MGMYGQDQLRFFKDAEIFKRRKKKTIQQIILKQQDIDTKQKMNLNDDVILTAKFKTR
jgi:hypothetical protein